RSSAFTSRLSGGATAVEPVDELVDLADETALVLDERRVSAVLPQRRARAGDRRQCVLGGRDVDDRIRRAVDDQSRYRQRGEHVVVPVVPVEQRRAHARGRAEGERQKRLLALALAVDFAV